MEIFQYLLILLTGCGVFIAGMNMLSGGLEKTTGPGLKKLLGKISNNRFSGVGIGLLVTALVQSSSATTVMTIGFVNAGVMNLFQATSIIMGANIGTTVTGLIVSLSAFDVFQKGDGEKHRKRPLRAGIAVRRSGNDERRVRQRANQGIFR